MNYRYISRILGWIFLVFAGLMLLPVIVGLIYREQIGHFMIAIGVSALVGGILLLPKQNSGALYARDGFVIVGLGWIGISLVGALPFRLSGSIPIYTDALFETVSGFTTTGASILNDVEALSHTSLFWRSFTHWIGGMGVLVLTLALLPKLTGRTAHLVKAESPGPSVGKLVPKIKSTAGWLYKIYAFLTGLEFILNKVYKNEYRIHFMDG